jgi:hypothetical protein
VTCPAKEALVAWIDEQVRPDQARVLATHVQSCALCADEVKRLRAAVGQLAQLELAQEAPAFTSALLTKLRARPAKRPLAPALAVIAALAACLVVWQQQRGFEPRGGGSAIDSRLGFEVYVHEPGLASARLQAGQRLALTAGYSFVVVNRSQEQQYLMLFALDARAAVHWFYPAFLDPKSDPRSLLVPAAPQVRALPEGITPDRSAPGPVRFVALFTAAPLRVADVEARIRSGGLDALARAHPQLQALSAELVSEGAVE